MPEHLFFQFQHTTTPAFITATGRARIPVPMPAFKKCIKVWKYLREKENYISVESLKTNPDQEYYKSWFIKKSFI